MNILVAGGGFVGDAMLDEGHCVTVVDSFITGRHANLADARFLVTATSEV